MQEITAEELFMEFESEFEFVIIDVRSEDDYSRFNIEGPRQIENLNIPFDDFLSNEEEAIAIENELVTNGRILQEKQEELKDIDRRISNLILDDKEFEAELMDAGDYNRLVLKTIVAVTRRLDENMPKPNVHVGPNPGASKYHTRLEKLKLKSYDGDPLQYQSFWDSFESAVHNDTSLDNIIK